MRFHRFHETRTALIALIALIGASATTVGAARAQDNDPSPPTLRETAAAAEAESRAHLRTLDFEAFKAGTHHTPGPGGTYVVNGDTPILNEKHLREYWERMRAKSKDTKKKISLEATVATFNKLDQVWPPGLKRNITYCISTGFGPQYAAIRDAMAAAAAEWAVSADILFVHRPEQDSVCDQFNEEVLFDVRPIASGHYIARAFSPGFPRHARTLLVDVSAFADKGDTVAGGDALRGTMLHELGHILGLRHEFTRHEAKKCFESHDFRPLTDYDAFSIMQYPRCSKELTVWPSVLTDLDRMGAVCLYGPRTANTPFDLSICTGPKAAKLAEAAPPPKTVAEKNIRLARDADRRFGPYPVAGGFGFVAAVVKPSNGATLGDPDIYVKFDALASQSDFDCRPLLMAEESESCTVHAPDGARQASVYVHAYEAAEFDLEVIYVPLKK